jgi:N-acyl-D-aspartate/D-glutamate deacylase
MFDYAIKNGLIVDGTGEKPYKATLYIEGEKIAKISEDDSLEAKEVIDAAGLAPQVRGEVLTLDDMARLHHALKED